MCSERTSMDREDHYYIANTVIHTRRVIPLRTKKENWDAVVERKKSTMSWANLPTFLNRKPKWDMMVKRTKSPMDWAKLIDKVNASKGVSEEDKHIILVHLCYDIVEGNNMLGQFTIGGPNFLYFLLHRSQMAPKYTSERMIYMMKPRWSKRDIRAHLKRKDKATKKKMSNANNKRHNRINEVRRIRPFVRIPRRHIQHKARFFRPYVCSCAGKHHQIPYVCKPPRRIRRSHKLTPTGPWVCTCTNKNRHNYMCQIFKGT